MILAPEHCSCPYQDPGPTVADSPACNGYLLFMAVLSKFISGRCAIADPCNRITGISDEELLLEYDFIVVGGGTSGAVVAGRLSESGTHTVLLIEAGGAEPVASRVPSFYPSFAGNAEVDWRYRTQPGNYCGETNGLCRWPRGKGLGGSSLINGMMYHRGHAADYDYSWAEAGARGWSWKEILPYFYRSEGNNQIGTLVDEKYHSDKGPMPVEMFRYQPPLAIDLLEAVEEAGLLTTTDINDPHTPDAFAVAQSFTAKGQRFTTARAYLWPSTERSNLHTKLYGQVLRVIFDGNRAVAVEYESEEKVYYVKARKEIILTAGALNTPQILMHSGIGPIEDLSEFGIPVLIDLPVGEQLINHVGATLHFLLRYVDNVQELNWAVAAEYLLNQEGPMSGTGLSQVTGLLYSSLANRTRQQPDLQYFFNGAYAACSATGAIGEPVTPCSRDGMNISINSVSVQPRSRGYMKLKSSDPRVPLLFFPEYFTHPEDMIMVKDAIAYLHRIVNAPTLKQKYGLELNPSFDYCSGYVAWSDAWAECIARYYTNPQHHQVGTAAIAAVVDDYLHVYGVEGLRVADASVIPSPPTGNPQAVIMMVAERCAQFIFDKWGY